MTALGQIAAIGVVPVVVLDDPAAATPLADALLAGNLPCAEITFRTAAAPEAIEQLAREPRLLVGAGTVLTPAQVEQAVKAGARFIVSPGFDADVVRRCRELDVAVLPGIATATDAMAALRAGLDTVKLFPAGALGGLPALAALAAPFPALRFVPTGGITQAELGDYARHPAVLAVGGSWITPRELVAGRRFDEVTRRASEAVTTVAAARDHRLPSG